MNQKLLSRWTLVNGVAVITITAPQLRDARLVAELRDELLAIVSETNPRQLVFDLSEVTFIGSVGFLAFLSVRRAIDGGRIVLCQLSQPVREVFALCQLISSDPAKKGPFEVADSATDAMALLSS